MARLEIRIGREAAERLVEQRWKEIERVVRSLLLFHAAIKTVPPYVG